MTIYNPNIELVNDNVYIKFGLNKSIRSQDIEKPEDQWSCKCSPDILAKESTKHTKPRKYMVKK